MRKRRLLEVAGLLLLAGCSETRSETWQVAAHRASCLGEAASLCLIVQRPGSSSPQFHYFGVVGFDPQWGHEYTIDVQVTPVSNPPQDGSSEDVTLRGVKRDEAVPSGTTFRFRVFEAGPGQNEFLSDRRRRGPARRRRAVRMSGGLGRVRTNTRADRERNGIRDHVRAR